MFLDTDLQFSPCFSDVNLITVLTLNLINYFMAFSLPTLSLGCTYGCLNVVCGSMLLQFPTDHMVKLACTNSCPNVVCGLMLFQLPTDYIVKPHILIILLPIIVTDLHRLLLFNLLLLNFHSEYSQIDSAFLMLSSS